MKPHLVLIKPLPANRDVALKMCELFRKELESLRKKPAWNKQDRTNFRHLKNAIITIGRK